MFKYIDLYEKRECHHYWGEKDFDWSGLSNAIYYCMKFWKRWGRIGSHGKEKYGTFRDHVYFWNGGIWGLIRPGYVWIGGPVLGFIYHKLDRYVTRPFTRHTRIHNLFYIYQKFIYNYAIQKMCKKYPHLTHELVVDLDYPEFVKPGLFGKVDGQRIHDLYWRYIE